MKKFKIIALSTVFISLLPQQSFCFSSLLSNTFNYTLNKGKEVASDFALDMVSQKVGSFVINYVFEVNKTVNLKKPLIKKELEQCNKKIKEHNQKNPKKQLPLMPLENKIEEDYDNIAKQQVNQEVSQYAMTCFVINHTAKFVTNYSWFSLKGLFSETNSSSFFDSYKKVIASDLSNFASSYTTNKLFDYLMPKENLKTEEDRSNRNRREIATNIAINLVFSYIATNYILNRIF